MFRVKPTNNEIYHIYNRGVEKRDIFQKEIDYLRFVHDLFEFNDEEPVLNINYYFKPNRNTQSMEVGLPYIKKEKRIRKMLVEILIFCLMPNHFHLLVKQKINNGVTEFMRKLGTGYANYFNQKYERVGPLFQGKYKIAIIKQEAHLIHLPYYIHTNPLDLTMPEWRNKEIKDYKRAMKFLENYRWSSFPDYIGKKNFPSVTQREFLLEFFDGPEKYKNEMIKWLKERNIEEIRHLTLEG